MSNSNHVERVTLTIETGNGEMHRLVVTRPGPGGSNPRFMAQELESAVDELCRRADDLLMIYGDQIKSA